MAVTLTLAALGAIMNTHRTDVLERYLPFLVQHMAAAGITTRLRVAHFLAQIGHESGSFRWLEELASGADYEGREDLGNTEPGDGRRFKGRGLIQLTGRANYAAFGKAVGMDLVGNPELVAKDPSLAVRAATWFWTNKNLNAAADADDIERVTRRVNGGLNGLVDRMNYLDRAYRALGVA